MVRLVSWNLFHLTCTSPVPEQEGVCIQKWLLLRSDRVSIQKEREKHYKNHIKNQVVGKNLNLDYNEVRKEMTGLLREGDIMCDIKFHLLETFHLHKMKPLK